MNSEHQKIKEKIVEQITLGLEDIDKNCLIQKKTTTQQGEQKVYLRGLASLDESKITSHLVFYLEKTLPNYFDNIVLIKAEKKYKQKSKRCDIVIIFMDDNGNEIQVDIEIKHIRLIGDNGKDYNWKPIRTDEFWGDIKKLNKHSKANIKLVIAITYEYDQETLNYMRTLHPEHKDRLDKIGCVLYGKEGKYNMDEDLEKNENYYILKGMMKGKFEKRHFRATTHPCAGRGTLVVGQIN